MQQAIDRQGDTNGLFAATPRRAVDTVVSGYMKDVNDESERLTGLRYHEVYRELHGEVVPLDPIRSALDRGVSPRDFVAGIASDFGLTRLAPGLEREEVAAFNRAQVALVAFSGQTEDWVLTQTGKILRQEEDGVAHIGPVRDRTSGRMGFGVRFYEGATLDGTGRVSEVSQPINVTADFDIGTAVERYEAERALSAGPAFR